MNHNPLKQLEALGQSIWLDYTRRDLIASGELKRLIEADGLSGMTSNPSIFQKAIADSQLYDQDIKELSFEGQTPNAIYEILSRRDVQNAAGDFLPVYERLDAGDGYVSLEVNPHLAHDTKGTVVEARRLWRALARPNVFIKVPATAEGIPAIQQLISEGINVNITLLFGLPRYQEVADAYLSGLESRASLGKPLQHVASVASFFVSRIDVLADGLLEKVITQGGAQAGHAKNALGQVAISSAKIASQIFQEIFNSNRFKALAARGARVQRLLWASTSTKNPAYSDLKYVEALIGPETINTLTVETLAAYRNHGEPKSRLAEGGREASSLLASLPEIGINLDLITARLEREGVEKFNHAFDKLISALKEKSSRPAEMIATK